MSTSKPLRGESILYLGPEPWQGLWRNRHQLMTRFARGNAVMYVEPRIYLRQLLAGFKSGRIRIRDLFRPLASCSDGVHVFHSPVWVPISGKRPLASLFTWAWRRLLRRAMKARGMRKPIVWLSRPEMVRYLHLFDEKLSVYHVVDEYSEYYGMTAEVKRALQAEERALLAAADLTVVVSESLYQDKRRHARAVHLVPNAVDYAGFHEACGVPADLAEIPRPIIGYSGLVASRLDLLLLAELADRHPGWSIVLVGQVVRTSCEEAMDRLERLANVHFLGSKTVQALPAYIKRFDVGIIPYKTDRNADNCSPLKLYEYMAAGIPVVASNFATARQFAELVYVAADGKAFATALETILAAPASAEVAARVRKGDDVARVSTWDDRIAALSGIIRARLDRS